jgi:hypothetical protein
MSIKEDLTLNTRQRLVRKGKTVRLEIEMRSPDDALLLFDKIQHSVQTKGGLRFCGMKFHEIREED